MVDISITATTRRAQFTGNTGLGPFAFTFNVLDESDVTVIKNSTELVVATDYTVTVNADGTGSVTLTGSGNGTALISSDVLTILGDRPLSRTSDYTQGGNLFASAINEDLDSLVIGLQQVDEKIDRSLRIQPGDEFIDLTLPLRADRANNYLAFDASGDPVVVAGTTSTLVVTAFAETLLDDSNAPAMLNTLGLSATAAEINLLDGVTWTPTDFNALTATPAEINVIDGDTAATATTLVDADRVVANDAGTMKQVAMSDVSTYTFGSLSIDEDDMSSDSATKLPTQQSVKAYADAGDALQIGVGQTWQDVSASRAINTSYQNSTGKPIMVAISTTGSNADTFDVSVDNSVWVQVASLGGSNPKQQAFIIVPSGHYYRCGGVFSIWVELR